MFAYDFLKKHLSQDRKIMILKWVNRLSAPIPNQPLKVIALRQGTDKLLHGYVEHYARHFAAFRQRQINVLEIGVGGYDNPHAGGNSLRMWQEYFPKAMIYSMDIYDKRPLEDARIKIFLGSQNDHEFLEWVVKQIGRIDLIIDDGSHVSEHIITSFNTLFPHLAEGGWYVIEDLYNSYATAAGGNSEDLNDPNTSMSMLKRRLDGLQHNFIVTRAADYYDQNVAALHCYPKIAFILKGKNEQAFPPKNNPNQ